MKPSRMDGLQQVSRQHMYSDSHFLINDVEQSDTNGVPGLRESKSNQVNRMI